MAYRQAGHVPKKPRYGPESYAPRGANLESTGDLTLPGIRPLITITTVADKDKEDAVCSELLRLLQNDDDTFASLGHCLSFMIIMFKQKGPKLILEIEDYGYRLIEVPYEEDVDFFQADLSDARTKKSNVLLTVLGQLCFLPFMNFSEANFMSFMAEKTDALCARTGALKNDVGIPVHFKTAWDIRRVLGCLRTFQQELIRALKVPECKSTRITHEIADYVLSVLEYSDMTAYYFILSQLFRTGSPVLFLQDLADEVDNFLQAVELVCTSEYPRFFAIFAHPRQSLYVQRNKFPILYAVAVSVASSQHRLAKPACFKNLNTQYILRLVELHKAHTEGTSNKMSSALISDQPRLVNSRMYQGYTGKADSSYRLHLS